MQRFLFLSHLNNKMIFIMVRKFFFAIGLFLMGVSMLSCTKDKCEKKITYIKKDPIYKDISEIRSKVGVQPDKTLQDPGKIYYRTDQYLFVNERLKGIHIFDNSDPKNPQKIGYINIPGNTDMAIRRDVLYANSFVDLYAIDISDPSNVSIIKRKDDVFKNARMNEDSLGIYKDGKGVIADFNKETKEKTVECSGPRPEFRDGDWVRLSNNSKSPSGGSEATGVGGSMARFAVTRGHLYCVDWENLSIFNVENPSNPRKQKEKQINNGIETIFPYEKKLFIGSRTGMFIYDNANPKDPQRLSQFRHVQACDPVYPTDSFAYVTLNGGRECGTPGNQLDVIDITNIQSPNLISSFSMEDPKGLVVKNKTLFLCDGKAGLKVYDTKDPRAITDNMKTHKADIDAFDAIAQNDLLMVIGESGLYQYDKSNPGNLKRLSFIPAN